MKLLFQQRIIALLFNAERYGLKSGCFLLCLITYLARDHFSICLIVIFFCLILMVFAYSFISKKNRFFYFGLLSIMLIQIWRVLYVRYQAKAIEQYIGDTVYLELTAQNTLFQTNEEREFKIYQSKNGARLALWVEGEQRYWQKICGYFRPKVPQRVRNPGGFNQKEYLANYNCYAVLDLKDKYTSIQQVTVRMPILDRNKLLTGFQNYIGSSFDPRTVDFILSLCFGRTENLSPDLKQDFRNLGLSHLLAVSGFHFDLFLMPLLEGFNFKKRNLKIQFLLLPLILFYNWLCAYPIGLIRASLIYTFMLITKYLGLDVSRKNILLFIMQLFLLINPWLIFQVNFQLSFISSLAIYYYLPYLKKINIMQKSKFLQSMFLSFLVQIIILPFLIKNFGIWQIGVILVSGLLNFPLTFFYLTGLFSFYMFLFLKLIKNIIFLDFRLTEQLSRRIFDFLHWLLNSALQIFSRFARADFWLQLQNNNNSLLTWLILGLLILSIGLIIGSFLSNLLTEKQRLSLTFKTYLPGFILMILLLFNILRPQLNWQICFLDVGQGDCCLIISPERNCILIDGGIPGQGYRTILPALNYFGITKIDYAIISHLDSDHYGGIVDLLELRRIEKIVFPDSNCTGSIKTNYAESEKNVYIGNNNANTINKQTLCDKCDANGVKYQTVKQSDILSLEPLIDKLEILSPAPQLTRNTQNQNDYSLCFVLEIAGLNLMFTGDLSNTNEQKLISEYQFAGIDILKVAHHGSKYSTSEKFLHAVDPELAVISVGNNYYGHPAPELLERLIQYDIEIKRTDLNGAIMLELIDNQWHLATYVE
ncbi:MAG: DNA internalization-related competence protein ComEC/Rec2 [Clostridiaceae bacterium]|nr:DNA internalization-related competence protein ComEC/Rec2 [Clostridiaceae bacterium]